MSGPSAPPNNRRGTPQRGTSSPQGSWFSPPQRFPVGLPSDTADYSTSATPPARTRAPVRAPAPAQVRTAAPAPAAAPANPPAIRGPIPMPMERPFAAKVAELEAMKANAPPPSNKPMDLGLAPEDYANNAAILAALAKRQQAPAAMPAQMPAQQPVPYTPEPTPTPTPEPTPTPTPTPPVTPKDVAAKVAENAAANDGSKLKWSKQFPAPPDPRFVPKQWASKMFSNEVPEQPTITPPQYAAFVRAGEAGKLDKYNPPTRAANPASPTRGTNKNAGPGYYAALNVPFGETAQADKALKELMDIKATAPWKLTPAQDKLLASNYDDPSANRSITPEAMAARREQYNQMAQQKGRTVPTFDVGSSTTVPVFDPAVTVVQKYIAQKDKPTTPQKPPPAPETSPETDGED